VLERRHGQRRGEQQVVGAEEPPRRVVDRLAPDDGASELLGKRADEALRTAGTVLSRLPSPEHPEHHFVFEALVLLLIVAVRRQPLPHAAREWVYLAGMAVLANIAPYLLLSWSEQRISSGLAGALSGTTPLVTLLLARAFGVGRLTVAGVLGLALGLAA
jgi:EamA-like transporter family